mmetsp:Transcript_70951/g.148428  ORF Transcript_70951/g.148428 Transcript_70951/m.148428 type:complete len:85 (+) Transcript_70951:191-445(+)
MKEAGNDDDVAGRKYISGSRTSNCGEDEYMRTKRRETAKATEDSYGESERAREEEDEDESSRSKWSEWSQIEKHNEPNGSQSSC